MTEVSAKSVFQDLLDIYRRAILNLVTPPSKKVDDGEYSYNQLVAWLAEIVEKKQLEVFRLSLEHKCLQAGYEAIKSQEAQATEKQLAVVNWLLKEQQRPLESKERALSAYRAEAEVIKQMFEKLKSNRTSVKQAICAYWQERENHPCAPGSAMRNVLNGNFFEQLEKVLLS